MSDNRDKECDYERAHEKAPRLIKNQALERNNQSASQRDRIDLLVAPRAPMHDLNMIDQLLFSPVIGPTAWLRISRRTPDLQATDALCTDMFQPVVPLAIGQDWEDFRTLDHRTYRAELMLVRLVKFPVFVVGKRVRAVWFRTVDRQPVIFLVVGLHLVAIVARDLALLGHAAVDLAVDSPMMFFAGRGVEED